MPTGLVVHLEIVPEKFDEFVAIVRAHGERSVAVEPGCLSFQVMLAQDQAHKVILVEVYADEAALESHWDSPHMAAYREQVESMIGARERFRCTL
jgi:quinol monooxygenase YgiN